MAKAKAGERRTEPVKKEAQEPRVRNAAETKASILKAARTLFSRDVYRNVGTRDIAAAAGVNLTLINRYFGSKKNLFSEVVLSMRNTVLSPDGAQTLSTEVIADLLAEGDNPRKEKLRLLLFSSMDSDVSDVVSEFFLRQRRLRAGLMQGEAKETRAFLALSTLVGISLSFFLLPEEDRRQLDKACITEHFIKTLGELFHLEGRSPASGSKGRGKA